MPVCRHFMPLKSARFLIGLLNQPNACGPEGRIGIQYDVELELLLVELLQSSKPPPWCIQPMASI